MTLNMSFRHMDPSKNLRAYAKEKSEKLEKYFRGRINVTWNFSHEKQNCVVHCHLVGKNVDYFGEAVTGDFRASIDLALEKVEKQIRKHKEVVKDHLHHNHGVA